MIVWANRLSLPLLDGREIDAEELAAVFAPSRARASRPSISRRSTGCPTVLGVVRAPGGFPGALGVGAAAAPTVEQAWWKALAEAFAVRSAGAQARAARAAGSWAAARADRDRSTITSATTPSTSAPARRRSSTRRDANAGRRESRRSRALGRPSGSRRSADRVVAAGSTAYAVDVTSPDVATLGLTVTQGRRSGALRARRPARRTVPRRPPSLRGSRRARAAAGACSAEDDVNPDPHPFP